MSSQLHTYVYAEAISQISTSLMPLVLVVFPSKCRTEDENNEYCTQCLRIGLCASHWLNTGFTKRPSFAQGPTRARQLKGPGITPSFFRRQCARCRALPLNSPNSTVNLFHTKTKWIEPNCSTALCSITGRTEQVQHVRACLHAASLSPRDNSDDHLLSL